jgi:hypothetical protein
MQYPGKGPVAEAEAAADATQLARRNFFRLGTACALVSLAGCDWLGLGGLDSQTSASAEPGPSASANPTPVPGAPAPAAPPSPGATPPPAAPLWSPSPTFVEGTQVPFDLATTLPAGVARGGIFAIDPAGAPLPAGMSLTSRGLLYAGTARTGTTAGVVFRYTEPS